MTLIFAIFIGLEVGAVTGEGIFDSGSWGQFLGGTHSTDGKDIGFTDNSHIVGRGIVENPSCVAAMMCSNISMPLRRLQSDMAHSRRNVLTSPRSSGGCYTAPFVRCNVSSPWTPLWNLHIHSKHTERFRSTSCECQQ